MSDETKVKEVVIPELVLDPTVVEAPVKVEEEAKYEPMLDMKNLSAQEQQIVKDFSSKIDLNISNIFFRNNIEFCTNKGSWRSRRSYHGPCIRIKRV